jgi:hypothetical protein
MAPEGLEGAADDEAAVGGAIDQGVEILALTASASAEAFPDRAVEAASLKVGAEIAQLGGVFGEGELAAVDGGGHGRQAVEVLCLRCTDPTLSAVHHARGAVAICDVRLLPPTVARLLPASGWPAGPALPHGLHASACAPPLNKLAFAAPASSSAWRSSPLHSPAPSPPPCTRHSRSSRTHACAPSGQPFGCSSPLHGGEGDCKLGNSWATWGNLPRTNELWTVDGDRYSP